MKYDDEITAWLHTLSIEQLEQVERAALKKAREREEARRRRIPSPPRTSNDIQQLAEMQGLDISGLMREIKRR